MTDSFPRAFPLKVKEPSGDFDLYSLSDPSTRRGFEVLDKTIREALLRDLAPDYSPLYLILFDQQRGDWDQRADLLDPPDSYPFTDYADMTTRQREMLLTCRVSWAIEHNRMPIEDRPMVALVQDIQAIANSAEDDQWEATTRVAARFQKAWDASQVIREASARIAAQGPQPARPGHLMAEGSAYANARAMIKDQSAYQRKVIFNEPVNAYTMLYGDRIAKGGDMLTSVTLTDSTEFEVKDQTGRVAKRYSAMAANL